MPDDIKQTEKKVKEILTLEDLNSYVGDLVTRNDEGFLAKIREIIDEKIGSLTGIPANPLGTLDDQEKKAGKFESFGEQLQAVMRAETEKQVDKRLIKAPTGLSESIPSDGGYAVQSEFSKEIVREMYEQGAILSRCKRVPIGADKNGLTMNYVQETSRATGSRWGGIQGYWYGEAEGLTASKIKLGQKDLKVKKVGCAYYATDELLEDAAALGPLVSEGVAEELTWMIEDAIFGGSGAGQPLGILNAPVLKTISKENGQAAKTINVKNLDKMYNGMWAKDRTNAVWFINQDIESQLDALFRSDGAFGQYVFTPAGGIADAPYSRIKGRQTIPVEQCQTLGTKGDIIFANMGKYLIIEKGGVDLASSIHVRFLEDEQVFKFRKRIDGQPIPKSKITAAKGSSTYSPFVVLESR